VAALCRAFRTRLRICPGVAAFGWQRGAWNFREEDFARSRAARDNKSTADQSLDDECVAIFAAVSTRAGRENILGSRTPVRGTTASAGSLGIGDMRQLGSLLSSAPSRIRRRLAQIVAIAAASLPAVGA
jgi:hypothetical protein